MANTENSFAGFAVPTSNFFQMPNRWTDITADIDSLAELKVIEYVLRHTWGFQEYGISKTISIDEFVHGRKRTDGSRIDRGTGLSEPSVKDGLKRAIKHQYLTCTVNDEDLGRVKKSYALKMLSTDELGGKILTGQDTYPPNILTPRGEDTYPPQGKKVTPGGQESYPRTEKETIETNQKKETIETNTPAPIVSASVLSAIADERIDIPSSLSQEKKVETKPTVTPPKKEVKKPVTPAASQQKLPPASILTDEEQVIYGYWCQVNNGFKVPITNTLKQRCNELAPVIHSAEELKSLYDFVRSQPFMRGKNVHLGNLPGYYTAWLSATQPMASTNGQGKSSAAVHNYNDFRGLTLDERKAKLNEGKQEISQELRQQIMDTDPLDRPAFVAKLAAEGKIQLPARSRAS